MEDELRAAVGVVREGGVTIYPTDTLYGLGADALNAEPVERIFRLKRRTLDRPVSVATTRGKLNLVAETEGYEGLVDEIFPGPVTLLLPPADGLPDPLVGDGKVGVRVPDDELCLGLLELSPPLTSTSANVSGEQPPASPLDHPLSKEVDFVLDDGPRKGEPSTVYDAVSGEVVRRGALPIEELEAVLAQDT